jgi:hypothetical protein
MAEPYIETTYNPDGTMTKKPVGFGGKLCKTATEPYMRRQGHVSSDTETPEAKEPSLLEREQTKPTKERKKRT